MLIRIVFMLVASLATLFVMFWGMSMVFMPLLPRDPVEVGEEVLDYELVEMPEVALPSASAPAMSLDTTGARLTGQDSNPAPSRLRGRWLAGPNANHFQLASGAEGQTEGAWLRLTGHTDELWAWYRSHSPAPAPELEPPGAIVGSAAATGAPLCLEVELLGHLGAQATDEAVASISVEQVEQIRLLDATEDDCLTP